MNTRTYTKTRVTARAFSLIELTVVILLIGVLAAGAAVAIIPQVKRAKINTTKNSMRTIKTSIDGYIVSNNAPPATLQAMIPGYLSAGSDLDSFDTRFYYNITPGAEHPYNLVSAGPDKDFTTEGDNINLWTMDLED